MNQPSGVGKSCLIRSSINNTFSDHYTATVGFEYFSYNTKVNDKAVKLKIWDTCGQELFRSLFSNFYRGTSLAILVFAIDK